MKRSCKNIDITDWRTDYPWVLDCIQRHYKRHDFRDLVCSVGGMSRNEYYAAKEAHDKKAFEKPAENVAREAAKRIRDRSLRLRPVTIRERVDKSSGKVRLIGNESAMQQIFDYIANGSAGEVWNRRLVPQQASSVKGRGQKYGMKMLQRWVLEDVRAEKWARSHGKRYYRKCRCYVKLDSTKCYQSLRMEVFLNKFRRDCGNEAIIWLWQQLLASHRVGEYEGFMIGALPSQWGCQYIMSFIYRYAMDLHKERRGKSVKLVTKSLFYMDDVFLAGSSRRDLKIAVGKVIKYAREEFGLEIKANWHIHDLEETPIDMMGYVVHADGSVTIRPRVFLRARRMALRSNRNGGKLEYKQAQRTSSYKGFFGNSNSRRITKNLNMNLVFRNAAKTVSDYERRQRKNESVFYQQTGCAAVYAPA